MGASVHFGEDRAVPPSPLGASLSAATGRACAAEPAAAVGGGCISECYRWPAEGGDLFVKLAPAERLDMFEAESAGLEEFEVAGALRVPRVLGMGTSGDRAFLALEWIIVGRTTAATEEQLGAGLARLHRVSAHAFGWRRDGYIGRTPQANGWSEDWPTFLRERRLRPQLELAARNGMRGALQSRGARLLEHVPRFFDAYRPAPSLLHGDLWGGNWFADSTGAPVVFDPAAYFGDREADIAMTRLFGGFGPRFYAAYEAAWPLHAGAPVRRALYDLYHVLNHANLFGGGYARQALDLINGLLAAPLPSGPSTRSGGAGRRTRSSARRSDR